MLLWLELFFQFPFPVVCSDCFQPAVHKTTTDFCILFLLPTTLLNLLVFVDSWGYLHIGSYHLWIEVVLLLPFPFGGRVLPSLAWLLWLRLPVQCWLAMVKVGIFILFLSLESWKGFHSLPLNLMLPMGFHKCPLSFWGSFLTFLLF